MGRMLAMGGSPFSGARSERGRGFVYWPVQTSREEVSHATRAELVRRSREAFSNDPFVRALLNNATRMVAGQVPAPATGDREWNARAVEVWQELTGNPEVLDVAGKVDAQGLQAAVFLTKFLDGDGGIVLARSGPDGDGAPRVRLYEGHQIGDNRQAKDRDRWEDGLWIDGLGKAQRYRVQLERGRYRDFGRQDFIHFLDYERPGQMRGLPRTYHLVNGSVDQREVEYLWMGGIKTAAQVGMYLKNVKKTADGPVGFGSSLTQVNNRAGSGSSRKEGHHTIDEVYNESTILELEDEELQLLHDQRPMPQQVEYLDYRKRAMALGFGLPVEVVWNMANLNAANARATLLFAQQFVDREQRWWAGGPGSRLYRWVMAVGIKMGMLGLPEDGQWWRHVWRPTARLSADFAKDGRVMLEILNTGNMSPDRWYAMQGMDVEEEDRRTVERWAQRRRLCEEAGLDFAGVFGRPNGTGAPVGAAPEPGAVEGE